MVRHGESVYNQENRFCGWHDADLATTGVEEAKKAGKVKDGREQQSRNAALFKHFLLNVFTRTRDDILSRIKVIASSSIRALVFQCREILPGAVKT